MEKGINLKVIASTKTTCPKCNKGELTKRTGKVGEFYGCSTYPSCKFTKPIE
ncbi:topoisomerase DNA-binding C4 zinc finger domain-containing protein [Vibrio coralliirubri]|uniref:topoisomerase DNA-binding C4 zinc finger domain-containing protein n=1 Tax=Vibrio coralliirubri TaxID=1516159 RepID=UPI003B981734